MMPSNVAPRRPTCYGMSPHGPKRHVTKEKNTMDEDRFNMALRKFLKEVGVTSQREIEKVAREHTGQGDALRLHMVLTSPDAPALNHVVEQTIPLT